MTLPKGSTPPPHTAPLSSRITAPERIGTIILAVKLTLSFQSKEAIIYLLTIPRCFAAFIKNEFDRRYNPTWHCIVGRNFGSTVTHESKHFIYFYLGQVAILLFKSG